MTACAGETRGPWNLVGDVIFFESFDPTII
jgi:hypothetical protein